MNTTSVLSVVEPIAFVMLSAALVLTTVRLLRGPTVADRVVALDLLAVLSVSFIAMYALRNNQPVFLDAALVLALIAFLSSVAFARYLERRAQDE